MLVAASCITRFGVRCVVASRVAGFEFAFSPAYSDFALAFAVALAVTVAATVLPTLLSLRASEPRVIARLVAE